MGKTVYFQGSDLEKHLTELISGDKKLAIKDAVCICIRGVLTAVGYELWKNDKGKSIVVVDGQGKAIVKIFRGIRGKHGHELIADFSIKDHSRMKIQPIDFIDIFKDEHLVEIMMKRTAYLNLPVNPKVIIGFSIMIFKCIREWMEENPDDVLEFFSVFSTYKKELYISNEMLDLINRICEIEYPQRQ